MIACRALRAWLPALLSLLTGCAGLQSPVPVPAPPAEYVQLLRRGIGLLHERRHAEALASFDAAQRIWPDGWRALHRSGEALYRMDRYAEAAATFEVALRQGAPREQVLPDYWRAQLHADPENRRLRQQIAADIGELTRALPDDVETWSAAYLGYYDLELNEQRREALARFAALARTPQDRKTAASYFGYELATTRDAGRVEALARQYLEYLAEPEPPESIVSLSVRLLHRRIEDDTELERELQGLLERYPESINVRLAVAKGLNGRGLAPRTVSSLLERSLRELPRSELGQIESCRALDLCLELRLKAQHFYHLGVARQRLGDAEGAADAFLESIRLGLNSGKPQAHLGRLAAERGDAEGAIAHLRRAFELGNQDPAIAELLSRLLRQQHGFEGPAQDFFALEPRTVRFRDATTEAGLGSVKAQRVAWADYDGDGFDDLLLDGWRLLRNDRMGGFLDVTGTAGLEGFRGARGGIWADVDNDGLLDLYSFRHGQNRLALNQGNGHFLDASAMLPEGPAAPTEAAGWGDMDNDGWLDLYVANYERPGIERGLCVQDRLLRNIEGAAFADVTEARKIQSDEPMCGRGVVWSDADADGDQDIFVSNYRLDPNFLWLNEDGRSFRDVAEEAGTRGTNVEGYYGHTIGSARGDVDEDGTLDLFSANLAHPRAIAYSDTSRLMLGTSGDSAPKLVDISARSGLGFDETNADPGFADLDNDGDLDLYVTSIYRGRASHLYLNDGHGRFRDATWISGTRTNNAWGHAFADFDNDGDQDLLVASTDGIRLFRNETRGGHWLEVDVRDHTCNRFAVGSRIEIRYAGQGQVREVTAGRGTGSQDSLIEHFGLGDYAGPVTLRVRSLCGGFFTARLDSVDRVFSASLGRPR